MAKKLTRRKTSQAILQSLAAGVVPRTGAEHIVVGREAELAAIKSDFDDIGSDGGASFRLIVGRYGAGKSFLLQLLRNEAMRSKFVVADADLGPQIRLTGSKGEGLALYRQLMTKMATRTRPGGDAFSALLEKWIDDIQKRIVRDGTEPSSPEFESKVAGQVHAVIGEMEVMVHGFDFAEVLNAYWRGHRHNNDELKAAALRWLRGEFNTKTEARQTLSVRVIIDNSSWYDHIKLMAYFVRQIGYRGLVLFIDEAVSLYQISSRIPHNNNYERLLTIINDTSQGGADYLGVLLGATPKMVEDSRKGLFSHEALRTRLEESRFSRQGLRDMSSPLIRLDPLGKDEIHRLLQTIRDIHGWHYKYEPSLDEERLRAFMSEVSSRIGADTLLTPRDVLRDFISVLNLLYQNPDETFESILGQVDFVTGGTENHSDDDDDAPPYVSFQI